MNPEDEKEMQRLSELLHDIERDLAADAPQREALVKAGLALGMIFLQSSRGEIERIYEDLGYPVAKAPKPAQKKKAATKKSAKPKAKKAKRA